MDFQVVTDRQLPRIRAGRSWITFHFRKNINAVVDGVIERKTDTGIMKLSSPELTALDLLRYNHAVGGIDAAATVLSDLARKSTAINLPRWQPTLSVLRCSGSAICLTGLDMASGRKPCTTLCQRRSQCLGSLLNLRNVDGKHPNLSPSNEMSAGASRFNATPRSMNDPGTEHCRLVESRPVAEPRQVEQDLIIARALVLLFGDPFLREELRFRGGTALNKLHFPKPLRYSEDIDLARTKQGASKPIWDRVHDLLDPWLADPEYFRNPVAPALRYTVAAED